jgi:hypothetical protein
VNIYNVNNTKIMVTRAAILQGWRCNQTKLWRILLVKHVQNKNTKTVLCNCPPMEFLPKQPPPTKVIANVYELKAQPELVRYYHAAVGVPTKPTWVAAIKNRQFALWLGLTAKAVTKHFPELEETTKGHGRKTQSGLPSTKTTACDDMYSDNNDNNTAPKPHPPPCPLTKQREV